MEQGQVVLSTKEYMELVERANMYQMVMSKLMDNQRYIDDLDRRLQELDSKVFNLEHK